MRKQLDKTYVKPAKALREAAGLQVNSVSSTGNIKIVLKPTPEGEASATVVDVKQKQPEASQVAKADQPKVDQPKVDQSRAGQPRAGQPKVEAVTSASANSKEYYARAVVKTAAGRGAPKNGVRKPAGVKPSTRVRKPAAEMAPKSLASASAQSDTAFAPVEKGGRSSSLKPLGFAAAALGVLALGLSVLQFAGGKSEVSAQADVSADSETSALAKVDAAPKAASVSVEVAAVEPAVTSQPASEQSVADPKTIVQAEPLEVPAQDVVAQAVTPQVDPDKAAIVAPVSAAHENVVVAQSSDNLMQGAITAAISKLGSQPQAVAEPAEAPAVEKTNEVAPQTEIAPQTEVASGESAVEDAGVHVSTAQKLLLVSYLSSLPDKASEQDSEIVARMTAGTLAALSGPQTAVPEAFPEAVAPGTLPEASIEPAYVFDLVVKALADGLNEGEVDLLLNEAYAVGRISVPSSLLLTNGRVDSKTILALFAGK